MDKLELNNLDNIDSDDCPFNLKIDIYFYTLSEELAQKEKLNYLEFYKEPTFQYDTMLKILYHTFEEIFQTLA